MGRKLLVGVLALCALACGFAFFAITFRHGSSEGLIELQRGGGEGLVFGLGAIAFLVAAVAAGASGRSPEE